MDGVGTPETCVPKNDETGGWKRRPENVLFSPLLSCSCSEMRREDIHVVVMHYFLIINIEKDHSVHRHSKLLTAVKGNTAPTYVVT